jgi:hypothetical protein
MLEGWIVHSIPASQALATVPESRNFRPLIEFVLQLPLESHHVLAPLPYQYSCLNRVLTEHPC